MANKPQGLSPNFNSVVSPQIQTSFVFAWTFISNKSGEYQSGAQVIIYKRGSNTQVFSAQAGRAEFLDLSNYKGSLSLNTNYDWEVIITSSDKTKASSGKVPFRFMDIKTSGALEWPNGPDAYEYIGTRRYFNEIKANTIAVLSDYSNTSKQDKESMTLARSLFVSDIVPSKKDFTSLEEILGFIATKESSYKSEIVMLIEDGLGAGDIHKVYSIIDRLASIAPIAPRQNNISFANAIPLVIRSGQAKNRSVEDVNVDISWAPTLLEKGIATLTIGLDATQDVSYYSIDLSVGFTDFMIVHEELIFPTEQLTSLSRKLKVPMDHIELEHKSKSKTTQYRLTTTAIDKRGQSSTSDMVEATSNTVPLGLDSYKLRVKQNDLTDKKVMRNYYDIYNGKATKYQHRVTGSIDGIYYYAVKLYDINGSSSAWYYLPGSVEIDPLKAPGSPKPKITGITQYEMTISWGAVGDASYYEVKPSWYEKVYKFTTLKQTYRNLIPGTSHKISVRAGNRVGVSSWVSISAKTLPRPIVAYTESKLGSRVWRERNRILLQSGGIRRTGPSYMTEYDDREVLHGEWIELRDKFESGMYVKKGTRYGKNRSIFFPNHTLWRSKLKGREILSVQIYIKRLGTFHGYPDDGRFLNVYTHNYANKKSLPPVNKVPALHNRFEARGLNWKRGQGKWVTLPVKYGEMLRDNKIKGIAFYHPYSDKAPYEYMRLDVRTMRLKINYK